MKSFVCLIIGLASLVVGPLWAQNQAELLLSQQQKVLQDKFVGKFGNMTHLISGRQHVAYYPAVIGDPFLYGKNWVPGNLQTRQFLYTNIPLKYDAHLDALVYLPDSFSVRRIWVNPELVRYFSIHGKTYIHMGFGDEKEAMEAIQLSPGYFELIYQGKTLLLTKHIKEIKSLQNHTQKLGEFIEKDFRFLVKGDQIFYVKSRRKLLKALSDQAVGIKNFLKKSNIKYRLITDEQFVDLLTYYDSL